MPSIRRPKLGLVVCAVVAGAALIADSGLAARGKKPVHVDLAPAGESSEVAGFDNRGGFSDDGGGLVCQVEFALPGQPGNSWGSILHFDRASGISRLISASVTDGSRANGTCYAPAISPDGRYVVYSSYATDLVDGTTVDPNAAVDIFLHDLTDGSTRLISVVAGSPATGTPTAANGLSYSPQFSPDGRFVAFTSGASDLTTVAPHVTSLRSSKRNLFLHEIATGETRLLTPNAAGTDGANDSGHENLRFIEGTDLVLFESSATDLVAGSNDAESGYDVFLRDLGTGVTELVSVDGNGDAIANDNSKRVQHDGATRGGRFVLLTTNVDGLVPEDTNGKTDVFLRDRDTDTLRLVSVDANGTAAANGTSQGVGISPDGRFIVFRSNATDMGFDVTGAGEEGGALFVLDTKKDRLRMVNHRRGARTVAANGPLSSAYLSTGGRYLMFATSANDLVRAKRNDENEVFRYDLKRGKLKRLTKTPRGAVPFDDEAAWEPHAISGNGKFTSVFSALDVAPGDANGIVDLYVVR